MIIADLSDKPSVINILSQSFDDNKSVNYIIKQDNKRNQRVKQLMSYSFDVCHNFGRVFLSDDRDACALILLPDKKRFNMQSLLLDLKLIVKGIGLDNVSKASKREAKIKKLQPEGLLYYLWFIGVEPAAQHKGIGSLLLKEVIDDGLSQQRTICLETSTVKNISWYESFGFKVYNELDLGYRLYFLKRE